MNLPYTVIQMRFSGGIGGAESVAFSLAKILSGNVRDSVLYIILEDRSGFDACQGVLERVREFGVRCRVFRTGSRFSAALYRELKAALQEDRADIVHAHCYKSAFYSILLKRFGKGVKKVVFTLHGLFDQFSLRSGLIHAVNAAGLLWADRIVGCSSEITSRFRKYPLLRKKVELIQNCLFSDSRHSPERLAGQRAQARQRICELWGLDPDAVWIASVGRLTEQKNFPLFFEAAREMLAPGRCSGKVQYLAVGDGKLGVELKRLSEEMGLSGHLFFTSYVSDMDTLFTGIDILMLTSLWEGTPMSVLEAMAYGKPVVSTWVGGMPDIVQHGRTGFLVRGFDAHGLAEAALVLVDDETKRLAMGNNAHRFVITELSKKNWMERHIDMYRNVMAG